MDKMPKSTQHQEYVASKKEAVAAESVDRTRAAELNTQLEHEMSLWDACRLYPKAIFWVFVVSLSIIMEGYDIGLVPSLWAQPAFRSKYGDQLPDGSFQLKSYWQSLLTGVVQAGSIFGYWVSGIVIDRLGYKRTLHLCLVAITGFVFIIFFAPNVEALIAGEALLGVPWGIIQTLTTTYAGEVAPVPLRPVLTTYICMCWMIGGFIATGVLRGFVDFTTQWAYRIPFGLQWIWPVPIMVAVAFAPESPWWLVRVNRIDDAKRALLSLTSKKNTNYDVDAVVAMIQHTVHTERALAYGQSYKSCFTGTNLRRTEITCVAGAVPFLAGSGFGGMIVYFMSSAGLPPRNAFDVGLGANGVNLAAVIFSWLLVAYFGRRTLYLAALSIITTLLTIIGILGCLPATNKDALWGTAGIMIFYSFVYMSCLGAIAYVVVAEMPASDLRNKTVAIARIFLNLLNFAGSWLIPAMINPSSWNMRGKGAFVFAGIAFVTLVWTFFRLPESKGRTFGELDILFHKGVPARKFKETSVSLDSIDTDVKEKV
ncbi:putative MFS alpha-glucoside transporter [Pyrenochaeta sp. DS3sAY3a]|nr:putative MFS alpha-glucoside transporter [Pyrenochaeta sp. DS3sAY3a]